MYTKCWSSACRITILIAACLLPFNSFAAFSNSSNIVAVKRRSSSLKSFHHPVGISKKARIILASIRPAGNRFAEAVRAHADAAAYNLSWAFSA
jgi:hypothetical protein